MVERMVETIQKKSLAKEFSNASDLNYQLIS